jgi:hypothetical protein
MRLEERGWRDEERMESEEEWRGEKVRGWRESRCCSDAVQGPVLRLTGQAEVHVKSEE